MKTEYDVIIVGAGPAGLKCAEQLKDTELSVLIVERNKIIGPKVCGGGLTSLVESSNIPDDNTRCFRVQQTLLDDKQYSIHFTDSIKTVDRLDLGQYQLEKIKKSRNITILKDTKVISIETSEIITSKGVFTFKYLVGADGSSSIVRKHLGLKSKKYVGICCDIPLLTNDFIWKFNPQKMGSGYIWAFPHKTHTNIGIYFNPKYLNPKIAKEILTDYLMEQGHNSSDIKFKGGAINYSYKGCVFGNIFLAGDAAGLTSKVWGEGISHALTSGKEIGKKILNPNYSMIELNKTIRVKKRQERLFALIDLLPNLQKSFMKLFITLMKGDWFQYYFGIARPK